MKLTFFEVFGDPARDGECTVVREGEARLGIGSGGLQGMTGAELPAMIADTEYRVSGQVWTGWVNLNTRRQRRVDFTLLSRSAERVAGQKPSNPRIALLNGHLRRGEAIVEIQPRDAGHRPTHDPLLCFVRGSRILTAFGDLPVEALRVGDLVHTVDNGLQPITWIGERPLTPARVHADPGMAPVRIQRDSFGPGWPANDIWVSPHHRILLETPVAAALDPGGALVPACGLVDGQRIRIDPEIKETSYFHVMFEEHQILYVEGLPAESFYPCPAVIQSLDDAQRSTLFGALPRLEAHPLSYGPTARKTLSVEEFSILAA